MLRSPALTTHFDRQPFANPVSPNGSSLHDPSLIVLNLEGGSSNVSACTKQMMQNLGRDSVDMSHSGFNAFRCLCNWPGQSSSWVVSHANVLHRSMCFDHMATQEGITEDDIKDLCFAAMTSLHRCMHACMIGLCSLPQHLPPQACQLPLHDPHAGHHPCNPQMRCRACCRFYFNYAMSAGGTVRIPLVMAALRRLYPNHTKEINGGTIYKGKHYQEDCVMFELPDWQHINDTQDHKDAMPSYACQNNLPETKEGLEAAQSAERERHRQHCREQAEHLAQHAQQASVATLGVVDQPPHTGMCTVFLSLLSFPSCMLLLMCAAVAAAATSCMCW